MDIAGFVIALPAYKTEAYRHAAAPSKDIGCVEVVEF
jgi:uncharacterized protein YbaA (DUF1428 family)